MEKTLAPQTKRRGLKKSTRETLVAYTFLAPNFLGFALFTLVPVVCAIVLSFSEWNGVSAVTFIGIDNYTRLLTDDRFVTAFWNTIYYVALNAPLTIICGLLLAVLLNSKIIKGRRFFRTTIFFPYVASIVAVAAVWNFLFSPVMGPVNLTLSALGLENLPKWSTGKDSAMITVIMFTVWKNMGYYMIIFLAGLQNVNGDLYEAADLDGASTIQKFFNVTLPQLAPTTFFASVMVIIASFKVYNEVYMLTQGGPGTSTLVLVYEIYNEAFVGVPEYGYACAISMVLFLMVLIVTLIQFKFQNKD